VSPESIAIGSVIISAFALLVSFANYYSSNLKVGQILMTKPTIFFFGWDNVPGPTPKIFMRSLLFSTSSSGRVLENLYLKISTPTGKVLFSFWGHTQGQPNSLSKGSGLFVGKEGFLADHHFNPDPSKPIQDPYTIGNYEIEVYGRQFGDSVERKLGRYSLHLDEGLAQVLAQKNDGVLWSLNPQDNKYFPETRNRDQGISRTRDRSPRDVYFESLQK
jgi:hypothetical protein